MSNRDSELRDVRLINILRRVVIKQILFCDAGTHTGDYKLRLDDLYVSAEELAVLETLRNEP